MIADSSDKPRSVLRNTQAALSHVYTSLRREDLTKHSSVSLLVTSLVKSGTRLPMRHTPVMPISYFVNMFRSWDMDDHLSVKMLRMKCIVLLALCLMLRPSDIAPRAALFSPGAPATHSTLVFSEKHILFLEDGSATLTFFGTKNDSQRTGFECHLQPHADPRLDPVTCLKNYLLRTKTTRASLPNAPVFLTLRAPYRALESSGIAGVLNESISLAGLGGRGYTARSFRPTGATHAVHSDVEPDKVRRLGRWKTQDVFYFHYVQNIMPSTYTTDLLKS